MSAIGRAVRRHFLDRRQLVRVLAAALLTAVALVPSIARAHDRLERHRTPAERHSRFRWANSCESIPQRTTTVAVVVPVEGPPPIGLPEPPRATDLPRSDDAPRLTPFQTPAPRALRAPPSVLA